jgi:uracil-DNA glycosylase family 4
MSALTKLNEEIERCQDCELGQHRTRAVPGEGPENATLLFIGEAPGWHEDQQGRPFVGPAGKFLEELLGSINLKREQVFIANVIKCRPPSNRDPLPGEIQACSKWLSKQIDMIQPKMIVTLGRYSMAKYFSNQSISQVHGKAKKQDNVIYYAMYHPAAALHQGSLRKTIESDMAKIPQILAQAEKLTADEAEPQQLSLF